MSDRADELEAALRGLMHAADGVLIARNRIALGNPGWSDTMARQAYTNAVDSLDIQQQEAAKILHKEAAAPCRESGETLVSPELERVVKRVADVAADEFIRAGCFGEAEIQDHYAEKVSEARRAMNVLIALAADDEPTLLDIMGSELADAQPPDSASEEHDETVRRLKKTEQERDEAYTLLVKAGWVPHWGIEHAEEAIEKLLAAPARARAEVVERVREAVEGPDGLRAIASRSRQHGSPNYALISHTDLKRLDRIVTALRALATTEEK